MPDQHGHAPRRQLPPVEAAQVDAVVQQVRLDRISVFTKEPTEAYDPPTGSSPPAVPSLSYSAFTSLVAGWVDMNLAHCFSPIA